MIRSTPFILVVLFLAVGGVSMAQPPPTPQQESVAYAWLESTCTFGDDSTYNAAFRAAGDALFQLFAQATEAGLRPQVGSALDTSSVRRFRRRHGPNPDTVAQGQYRIGRRRTYDLGYKTRAVLGLGVIGTPRAIDKLRQLATSGPPPLKATARDVLDEIGALGLYTIR